MRESRRGRERENLPTDRDPRTLLCVGSPSRTVDRCPLDPPIRTSLLRCAVGVGLNQASVGVTGDCHQLALTDRNGPLWLAVFGSRFSPLRAVS